MTEKIKNFFCLPVTGQYNQNGRLKLVIYFIKTTSNGVKLEIFTSNPSQTRKAGTLLAGEVLKSKPAERALVFGLVGDLGGGKTCFLQGFAKGLGIKQRVLSPTFIIMRRIRNFYHIDCYRIQKPQEILSLGLKKIIANPQNIVAIEWADRIRKIMPKNTIWIEFEFLGENKRRIVVK